MNRVCVSKAKKHKCIRCESEFSRKIDLKVHFLKCAPKVCLSFPTEKMFEKWKKSNVPSTFKKTTGNYNNQNLSAEYYHCNNRRLARNINNKHSLSWSQFQRTLLPRSCKGSLTVKKLPNSINVDFVKCCHIPHPSKTTLKIETAKFIREKLRDGVSSRTLRLNFMKKTGSLISKHHINNIREREKINMDWKYDKNDQISTIQLLEKIQCWHNLESVTKLEDSVIIFRAAKLIDPDILLLDSTHKITK